MTACRARLYSSWLWSFAALASNPQDLTSMAQFHCIVNTVISLIGACLSAFVASGYFCNQFDMVHIQVAYRSCATTLNVYQSEHMAMDVTC